MIVKKSFRLFLLFSSMFLAMFYINDVYAKYYEEHAEGWHWYKNTLEKEDKEPNNEAVKDPVKEMKHLKATVEYALDQAILYPTDGNIKNYIALQNRISNQSSMFANIWQKVLLENPELNYSLVHPTNTLGKQVDMDIAHKKEDAAIAKLARESGLFFFYSSSCAYCRQFAPILKRFTTTYNITVIPITLDGKSLPEFPNSNIDKGQAAKFKVTVEPSLFAVNPYTRKAYPISQGIVSESDLRKRILDISQNFRGDT